MSEESLYRRAEKRADEKIAFYKHLFSFIGVNLMLIILNFLTLGNGDGWWFYWITIFWAIGLLVHFLKVFVLNGKLDGNRDEMIEKEMEKLRK
ncbi:2TM domain-containing protein [Methanobrevibacter sp.]|uniref:2TM domain-containing protein n=1 Tax=Methanobrevibacter sp. TaxID=66852 RepID=UPI003890BBE5